MKFLTLVAVFILSISTSFAQSYTRRVPGDVIQTTLGNVKLVNQCWIENVPVQQPQYGGYQHPQQEHSITGTVVGGMAGALLGSRFGKGSGRTAATVAGAIGGAVIGDAYGNHSYQQPQYAPPPIQYNQRQVCAQRMVQMYNIYVRDITGQSEVIASSMTSFAPGSRVIVVFYPNGEYVIE